jgi:hypothetical protein
MSQWEMASVKEKNPALEAVELRRYLRFSVHYLAYVYFNNEIINANVIDISEGGLGIIIAKKMNFHDEFFIKFVFVVDEAHQSHVQLKARVIWIEEAKLNSMYVAGMEITEIGHKDILVLKSLLDELYVRESAQAKNDKMKYMKDRE